MFLESLQEAAILSYQTLKGYKLRTFLTMLGISIGIFAITIVFTLVNSMKHSVSKNLSSLGNTILFVHNWPWKDNSEDWYKYFNRPKVSYDDFLKLKHNLQYVEGVAFEARARGTTLKSGDLSIENVTLRGVTLDYAKVNDLAIENGRYFTPIEIEAGRNVAVIGNNIAKILLGNGPYIGKTILVKGKSIKVVGVIEKQGSTIFGESIDDIMILPWPFFNRIFSSNSRNVDKLISVKAESSEKIDIVENEIIGLIRINRGLRPDAEDNFSINKQESLMAQLDSMFKILNIGGIFVSASSLFVGGFGIANIMFVAVKERTKEIGIQKAVGATKKFILMQFLLESVLLCVVGGLMGIGLTMLISIISQLVLNYLNFGLEVVISFWDFLIGIILSILIGLISGFLPSLSAAKLDPVDAMRAK